MKKIKLLNGDEIHTNEFCRGCFLLRNKGNISQYIDLVYDNGNITVGQDMEYPIPGFFIISTYKHISSYDLLDKRTREEISNFVYYIRTALRTKLEINKVILIQEEKDEDSHFHIWILPIWDNVVKKYNINPRVINNNIKDYMSCFDFENNADKILECNEKIKLFIEKVNIKG